MSGAAVAKVAFINAPTTLEPIGDDIVIGKDVLELLTGAMYADPLSIYREYIQNAADAIDEARSAGVYESGSAPMVTINIDRAQRSVTITDNGAGVPNGDFVDRLTAIGGSKKRGAAFRGFRGVGRLSGLGYCQEVVFRSRARGDTRVFEMHWDGRKLREVLRDGAFDGGLVEVVQAIAQKASIARGDYPPHFFQVELRKVARVKNDLLLNEEAVRDYISQVGPVGFHPKFSFGSEIAKHLIKFQVGDSISIELNDGLGQIYRPHCDEFRVTEKQSDRLHSLEFFEVPGSSEGVAAVGWVFHHSYFGALPRKAGIGGIRGRVGNIQVGGVDLFSSLFVEPRFNQWCTGEVHVLTDKLLPNGRRDDFEYSAHYENLRSHLAPRLAALMKICRERSDLRQRLKAANLHVQKARHCLSALRARESGAIGRKVAEWQCTEALKALEKAASAKVLGPDERAAIVGEHERLNRDLKRYADKFARRSPFRTVPRRRRSDVEELVRVIFDRIKSRKKAEDLAKRVLNAFR